MSKFKQGVTQGSKELKVTQMQRLRMDPISLLFGVGAVMIAILIFTQTVDTELSLAVKAAFMIMLSLPIMLFSLNNVNSKLISPYGILVTTIGVAVAFLSLVATVYIIPPAAAVTFPAKLFYANMAIIETLFFCYFLFRWLCTLFPWPAAAVITGLFFAPVHVGVYGWNPPFLVFAVIAMVIFCVVYYLTGSLFTAMGSHIIFNLMASAAAMVGPAPFILGFALAPAAFCLFFYGISRLSNAKVIAPRGAGSARRLPLQVRISPFFTISNRTNSVGGWMKIKLSKLMEVSKNAQIPP